MALNQNGHSPVLDTYGELLELISRRDAIVGVIGLGYVGLPLAHLLHSQGLTVLGYDNDSAKIEKLLNGESYIHHISAQVAKSLSESKTFTPTCDDKKLTICDVLIMCLPTPVGPHNEPDMSYVLTTTERLAIQMRQTKDKEEKEQLGGGKKKGKLIILESTTYPGATDTDIIEVLSKQKLHIGIDVFVAFSPEREDPGNVNFSTCNIPKLIGGVDKQSGILASKLYQVGGFIKPIMVSSARVAECAKLLENTYRAVNIALVNEMKEVFSSMNVNIWEVLDAANTKPFGFHRFNPGPGIGGHCIPIDPFYLTWKAKETGAPCSFIELAATVNANMPKLVVQKVQSALNQCGKPVHGQTILILGIAYKPNVDDIREAPALTIWEHLLDLGANVQYLDPFVPIVCETRKHMRLSQQRSVDWNLENDSQLQCAQFDAILLVTHHTCFEGYKFLKGFTGPIIDTRNQIPTDMGLNIVRA